MPVSSPSYFPPQRSTDRIVGLNAGLKQTGNYVFLSGQDAGKNSTSDGLIVIGHESLNGGAVDTPYALVLGHDLAQDLTESNTNGYSDTDAPIIIGYNSLNKTKSANGSIVMGSNNFGQLSPASAAQSYQGIQDSVVMSFQMMNGANALSNPTSGIFSSVVIGHGFYKNNTYWTGMQNCVVIGANIGNSDYSNALTSAVVVGTSACADGIPTDCVVIGEGALPSSAKGAASSIVVIGQGAAPNVIAGAGGVYIGPDAGHYFADDSNLLVIVPEIFHAATTPMDALICGICSPHAAGGGNISLFTSAADADLTLASATNILKLANGIVGTTNPTNGGYFYVDAGALHWVGQGGTDTLIAPA